MRFPGFIGPSYTLQSVTVDAQRCVNLYLEIDETGTGNEGEPMSLVGTPGLRLLASLPTGPVRGVYLDSLGTLWAVGGNVLYQVSSTWSYTAIGTLNTSSGPVSFSDNGLEGVVVDNPDGYSWVLSASTNELPSSYASTATSFDAAAITLTSSSQFQQYLTGGFSQTVVLPVASTMVQGNGFNFVNLAVGNLIIQTSGGETLITLSQGSQAQVTCSNISGGTGTASWSYTKGSINSNTFGQIIDPNFLGATQVTFMDGYLIFNKPSSQEIFISPSLAVTPFDPTMFGSAEASPDNIVGQIVDQEFLYLCGSQSLEVFYDSAATFPFTRVPGTVAEIGCMSAFSIQKIQSMIFWLGQDKDGRGIVYQMQGFQPQRISTYALEKVISTLGDLSTARAWTYQQSGHAFYCLNLPGAETTWCYDVTTGKWHERAFFSEGTFQRHLADCHVYAYLTNVVGDYSSGNLYALDPEVFTDNGNPIVAERAAPHLSKDRNRIFHSSFELVMETGVGADGAGQGANPQAMLQWSNDGGHTWSNERWAPIGKIGAYKNRVKWNRLGQARDRVYRVRISDPVKRTLISAQIEIEEGAS